MQARTLDCSKPIAKVRFRKLPHWSQTATYTFITWRTQDSIPKSIYLKWRKARNDWLLKRGIDAVSENWRKNLDRLPSNDQKYFHSEFTNRWQDELDHCRGECLLKLPEHAKIIADALRYFNGDRYLLDVFVIMPNHIHLIVSFPDSQCILKQCESWKRFTGSEINKAVNRSGKFWQPDAFDHLVRNEMSLHHFRRYIAENPSKAGLQEGDYLYWSAPSGK